MAADLAEPSRMEMPLHRQIAFWGFALLLALGIVFWLVWGLLYGVWLDNGVYAIVITFVGFGLAGMWLVSPDPPTPTALPPKA
jgi:hypothetical protein